MMFWIGFLSGAVTVAVIAIAVFSLLVVQALGAGHGR